MSRLTPFLFPGHHAGVDETEITIQETPVSSASAGGQANLRFIIGDKRHPTTKIKFIGGGNLQVTDGGLNITAGELRVNWTAQTTRVDGQKRINSARGNATIELSFVALSSTSHVYLDRIIQQLTNLQNELILNQERGEAQKIWLELQWSMFDIDLPAPVFGQWARYAEVRSIDIKPNEAYYSDMYLKYLPKHIPSNIATITLAPYFEGLDVPVGRVIGGTHVTQDGVSGVQDTNQIRNPDWRDGTTNWTVRGQTSGTTKFVNIIRDQFLESERSGKVFGDSEWNLLIPTLNSLATSSVYYLSFVCRAATPGGIVSNDWVNVWVNGARAAPTITAMRDGWYHVIHQFTNTGTEVGIAVAPGNGLIVDVAGLQNGNGKIVTPTQTGTSKTGNAHTATIGNIQYLSPVTDNGTFRYRETFSGEWSVSLWHTAYTSNRNGSYATLFSFVGEPSTPAQVYALLEFGTLNNIIVNKTPGMTVQGTVSFPYPTVTYGQRMHFVFVQRGNTIEVYLDGVIIGSVGATPGLPTTTVSGDKLSFGVDKSAADGARLWNVPLTTTQITKIYNDEKATKDNGQTIGLFPFLTADDPNQGLGNIINDGRGVVVAGIEGDVEAYTNWFAVNTKTHAQVWLGRKAMRYTRGKPATNYFHARNVAGTGNVLVGLGTTATPDALEWFQGRSLILFKAASLSAATFTRSRFTTDELDIYGQVKNPTFVAASKDYIAGDMTPKIEPGIVAGNLIWGAQVASASSITAAYLVRLPYPYRLVKNTSQNTVNFILNGDGKAFNATVTTSGRGGMADGTPVNLVPHKNNFIFGLFLQFTEGANDNYVSSDLLTIQINITPRWTLPGGAV